MKILIVDDMGVNLKLLEARLEGSGYEVTCAKNGVEALEKLKKDSFDMIISDILMPEMDGFQLCRECKKDDTLRKLPFVFYTATYTDRKDEEFAFSLGVDRFIVKPVEPDEFIKIIQGVIGDMKKGKIQPKKPALEEEKEVFKLYSERLVKKLEKKMLDLEREVAERKRAVQALRESEEKYRSLVESTEDSIYLVDTECRYLFMNQKHLSRFGLPPDRVIGRAYGEFHSERETREFTNKVNEVLETDKSLWHEYRSERDGGYFLRTLSPVKEPEGRTTAVTVVSKDITERKQAEETLTESEERFRALAESTSDWIWEIDQNGMYTYASPKVKDLLGYELEEVIGKTLFDLMPADEAEQVGGLFRDIVDSRNGGRG